MSPCSQKSSDEVSYCLGNMEQRGLCEHVCQTPDKSSVRKGGLGISQYIYASFCVNGRSLGAQLAGGLLHSVSGEKPSTSGWVA